MTTKTKDHMIWVTILAAGVVGLIAAIVTAVLIPEQRLAMVICVFVFAINLAIVGSTPP